MDEVEDISSETYPVKVERSLKAKNMNRYQEVNEVDQ